MFGQLLRNKMGNIRTYWNLFILTFSVLAIIVLNRIILRVIGLTNDTTDSQIVSGIMDLVAVTGLIYVLTTKLDGRDFRWAEIGLSRKPNILVFFGVGIILGGVLEIFSLGLSIVQGTVETPMTPNITSIAVLTGITAAMLNSFWQEIAFRGYLQTRFVENYGAIIGIPAVAVSFVLIHLLVNPLSPIEVLTGIILFLLVGLLYHLTGSIYLVGALHGTLNYIPRLLETWSQPLDRAIVYGLVLGLVLLFSQLLRRNKIKKIIDKNNKMLNNC
jgi:membrane protease YdiL (CAAX protease family)